jgi:hypothetical protein
MRYDPKQVFTSPAGPASFPNLNKPRQYKNKGVFSYDTNIILSDAVFTQEKLRGANMPLRDALLAWGALSVERSRLEPRTLPFGPLLEKDADGNRVPVEGFTSVHFKVDAETMTRRGEIWDRKPKFFDADGHPIIDPAKQIVVGGTVIRVKFTVWLTKGGDKAGVKLQPVAVQICKAVENAEAFERFESYENDESFEPTPETATDKSAANGDF